MVENKTSFYYAMIDFGKTLREAREAKGLTTAQIAEKTHMLVQVVEGLEAEDFGRIVAPIYGRGFVKLYCEAVGIADPKPLVDEFMEIYNGNRPANIRVRDLPPPPVEEPPAPPAEEPPPAPEPRLVADSLFDPPAPEPAPEPVPAPAVPEPHIPFRPAEVLPVAPPQATFPPPQKPLPSAEPRRFRMPGMPKPEVPSAVWRIALLALLALVVLFLVFLGGRAVYRMATTAPATEKTPAGETPAAPKDEKPVAKNEKPAAKTGKPAAPKVEKPAAKPAKPAAKPTAKPTAAPRTPIAVEPLYAD